MVNLEVVLFKDSCFEAWLQFEYEDLIRNKSVPYAETPQFAGSVVMNTKCSTLEASYLQMRKSLPQYFSGIRPVLDILESNHLCDGIYT